jgi:hypothetical protein
MSIFGDALDALFLFLEKAGQAPPTRSVRVVEIGPVTEVDSRGRPRVRREEFRDPVDYESRFQELLALGLPWINVSCYGVSAQKLVVAVEVSGKSSRQASRTCINYSGPAKTVTDHGWDAAEALAIE